MITYFYLKNSVYTITYFYLKNSVYMITYFYKLGNFSPTG
jgi:hypothetical protein